MRRLVRLASVALSVALPLAVGPVRAAAAPTPAAAGWVNPLDHMPGAAPASGAWADGTSRPLSTRFPSLAAAQAVYPRARALSEEIDGHALQKAFDACPVGGTVYLPPGKTFMVNFTILLWKGIEVVGGGTTAAGASYWGRYGQIQVTADVPAIRFDRNAVPAGHKNPGLEEYGPVFRGVRFRGNSTGRNQAALVLNQAFSGGSIEHCQFVDIAVGVGMSGTWVNRIVDNLFSGVGTGVRIDVTWMQAGPSRNWHQTNALRIEHNYFRGEPKTAGAHGVLVFGPGNSLTIAENTFENFNGEGSAAISLASYPEKDLKGGGEDLGHPLIGVEVRGNYEEANAVFLELGRPVGASPGGGGAPDARRTALSGPIDVLVTQNQYNCDHSANGSKVRIHACWRCTIRDNSARLGVYPVATVAQEIEFVNAFASSSMGAGWQANGDVLGLRGFHDDLDFVAERGWVGYPQNVKAGSVRLALRQRTSTRDEQSAERDWNAVAVGATQARTWQAQHKYAKGEFVTKDRHVYRCVVAGTSGGSGPAGTAAGIADGSARWTWWAPHPVDDRWKMLAVNAGTAAAPIDPAVFKSHKREYALGWRAMLDPSTPITP